MGFLAPIHIQKQGGGGVLGGQEHRSLRIWWRHKFTGRPFILQEWSCEPHRSSDEQNFLVACCAGGLTHTHHWGTFYQSSLSTCGVNNATWGCPALYPSLPSLTGTRFSLGNPLWSTHRGRGQSGRFWYPVSHGRESKDLGLGVGWPRREQEAQDSCQRPGLNLSSIAL